MWRKEVVRRWDEILKRRSGGSVEVGEFNEKEKSCDRAGNRCMMSTGRE